MEKIVKRFFANIKADIKKYKGGSARNLIVKSEKDDGWREWFVHNSESKIKQLINNIKNGNEVYLKDYIAPIPYVLLNLPRKYQNNWDKQGMKNSIFVAGNRSTKIVTQYIPIVKFAVETLFKNRGLAFRQEVAKIIVEDWNNYFIDGVDNRSLKNEIFPSIAKTKDENIKSIPHSVKLKKIKQEYVDLDINTKTYENMIDDYLGEMKVFLLKNRIPSDFHMSDDEITHAEINRDYSNWMHKATQTFIDDKFLKENFDGDINVNKLISIMHRHDVFRRDDSVSQLPVVRDLKAELKTSIVDGFKDYSQVDSESIINKTINNLLFTPVELMEAYDYEQEIDGADSDFDWDELEREFMDKKENERNGAKHSKYSYDREPSYLFANKFGVLSNVVDEPYMKTLLSIPKSDIISDVKLNEYIHRVKTIDNNIKFIIDEKFRNDGRSLSEFVKDYILEEETVSFLETDEGKADYMAIKNILLKGLRNGFRSNNGYDLYNYLTDEEQRIMDKYELKEFMIKMD